MFVVIIPQINIGCPVITGVFCLFKENMQKMQSNLKQMITVVIQLYIDVRNKNETLPHQKENKTKKHPQFFFFFV